MKTTMKQTVTLLSLALFTATGCSMFGGRAEAEREQQIDAIIEEVRFINEKLPPAEPMVLRVSGYGAINEASTGVTNTQKRLMAMRASKLDAYRTLAERVYGTAISGNTTVENLVVQNDRFRTYVDTYIFGARVVSTDVMPDGSYETVLEMVIDEGFRNCLVNDSQTRRNGECATQVVHDLDSFNRNSLTRQGLAPGETGLYFIQ
ncbi:LPP20 family lipoprotein [Salinispirillum marinum]|uniref:LPP20 family lipoprotein n=2 Tax=Saccharospirillaceae TaxID=255527 RepID=A0ABV8B962_9GAMM